MDVTVEGAEGLDVRSGDLVADQPDELAVARSDFMNELYVITRASRQARLDVGSVRVPVLVEKNDDEDASELTGVTLQIG